MKKKYEVPSAEKISFNYRDQVVAASGGTGNSGSSSGYTSGTGCSVINWIAREWGDYRLCFS